MENMREWAQSHFGDMFIAEMKEARAQYSINVDTHVRGLKPDQALQSLGGADAIGALIRRFEELQGK